MFKCFKRKKKREDFIIKGWLRTLKASRKIKDRQLLAKQAVCKTVPSGCGGSTPSLSTKYGLVEGFDVVENLNVNADPGSTPGKSTNMMYCIHIKDVISNAEAFEVEDIPIKWVLNAWAERTGSKIGVHDIWIVPPGYLPEVIFKGSSNGRTEDFESSNLGSNPSPLTKIEGYESEAFYKAYLS